MAIALDAVMGCLSILSLLIAIKRRDRAIIIWATGIVSCFVGYLLLLLQGTSPSPFMLLIGNTLLLGYNFSIVFGLRVYTGVKLCPRRYVVYLGLWFGMMVFFLFINPLLDVRIAITSTIIALFSFESIIFLIKANVNIPYHIKVLLVITFGFNVLFHVSRALESQVSPAPFQLASPSQLGLTLLVILSTSVIWSGSLLLMDIQRLMTKIEEDARDLRRLNLLKDRILAIAGHDLRGPIGSLRTIWDSIEHQLTIGQNIDIPLEMAGLVNNSIAGVLNLLDNLLSFTSDRQTPESRAILTLAVANVMELWEPAFRSKGIKLISNGNDTPIVRCDQAAVETVLRNIVGNALKFTPPGGAVTITVMQDNPEHASILIEDTGIGLDAQIANKKSEELGFKRSTGTGGERGSGLGLVIVKELVHNWGGSIRFESTVGKGTQVILGFSIDK